MATSNRDYKSAIYEQFARVGKAIANPARIELLDLLCQGPRSVELLAKEAGLGLTNASQQLKALREARLVTAEKRGAFVTYRLADPAVASFLHAFRSLSELRLAEIADITRRFLESRDGLEPVDRQRLIDKVRSGSVTVLDVRPHEEYSFAHLPNAISIPLKELQARLKDLPKRREIVAYCRGPYCVMAIEAVEFLRTKGFKAFRLEDGVSQWQARGYSVECGLRS
jgi:rhodanese-related sulfurtransferase